MRTRTFLCIGFLIVLTLLLSACWDQRLLRDHSLILAIGYDREKTDQLLKTVTFPQPTSQAGPESNQSGENGSKVVSTTGNTVKDAEKKMEKTIPEQFDRSKARFIIFGEDLAKEGIFSTLDSLYRDLRGPVNANLVVFSGKAQDALTTKIEKSLLVSDIYSELLDSAEQSGIIKNYNVQEARPYMLESGIDFVVPLLSLDEENKPEIIGTALFDDDKMTGTLDTKETIVGLILNDEVTKNSAINLRVRDEDGDPSKNFVNIGIRSNKQRVHVDTQADQIKAMVEIKLNVEIDEYAENHLNDEKSNDVLERKMEKSLEKIAEKTIEKLQKANNDSFGIGERVRAYHHTTWKDLDWKEAYKDVDIQATFQVHIVHHGIIN